MGDQSQMTTESLMSLGELLLGAAYADGECDGSEMDAIRAILARHNGGDLPEAVIAVLVGFDIDRFDLKRAASRLDTSTSEARRRVLVLVAEVIDADDQLTSDEDGYLRQVAQAIGAEQADTQGLIVDFDDLFDEDGEAPDSSDFFG